MNIERDIEVPTLRIHCTCRSYTESLNLDNSTRNMYNSYNYCIRTLHMPYQAGKLRLQHLLSFPGLITRDLIPQPSQGGKRLGYLWSRCQALEDWVVRVGCHVCSRFGWLRECDAAMPFLICEIGRTLGSIQAMGQCIKQCNVMQVMLSLLSLPSWSFLFISVMSPSANELWWTRSIVEDFNWQLKEVPWQISCQLQFKFMVSARWCK